MSRRRFSREFKVSAVKLVNEQGYSIPEAAKSLGVDSATIRYWIKKLPPEPNSAAASQSSIRAELRRLREENKRLLMEREILKKATAFFAKQQS